MERPLNSADTPLSPELCVSVVLFNTGAYGSLYLWHRLSFVWILLSFVSHFLFPPEQLLVVLWIIQYKSPPKKNTWWACLVSPTLLKSGKEEHDSESMQIRINQSGNMTDAKISFSSKMLIDSLLTIQSIVLNHNFISRVQKYMDLYECKTSLLVYLSSSKPIRVTSWALSKTKQQINKWTNKN